MEASREDLRRWIAQRRAAARLERRLARGCAPSPKEALRRGLGLIAFASALHGWPLPERPGKREEDLAAYECWARLRRRYE